MTNATISIPARDHTQRKKLTSFLVLFVVALLIGTFLRASLLVIYPFIVLFIVIFYRFRITPSFLILVALAGLSFAVSFFGGEFLKYKALSLFYMLPLLLILFCNVTPGRDNKTDHLSLYFTCLSIVALVNNVIGFIQIINNPHSDDSFVGIYSEFSVSINGLMLLNSMLFFYYSVNFIAGKKLVHLIPAIFFGASAILGFYGAGLIILLVAFVLAFFRFRIIAVIRTISIGVAALAIVVLAMYIVKPLVLEYNIANIKKFLDFNPETGARKVTSFYNYGISYPKDAKDFLLGSGPGTFNSRSAFMVGSPSYFQRAAFIKDEKQPYYFKNFAYSLWNESNTRRDLYQDGFRNQPFSSVLAFLGEYGLIFTFSFFMLYFMYYQQVARLFYTSAAKKEMFVPFRVFKFLIIFLPLLLLIDNYYEYPEVMIMFIVAIKFAHARIESLKLKTA
ncbi:MAG: hypothetical protein JNK79_13915 [Chitinophagaceae bacterium]|nr:hypothetical protein [Chitinophagaceae bacterium]